MQRPRIRLRSSAIGHGTVVLTLPGYQARLVEEEDGQAAETVVHLTNFVSACHIDADSVEGSGVWFRFPAVEVE